MTTIRYMCPECGRLDWGKPPNEWYPDAPVIHVRPPSATNSLRANCEGRPIPVLVCPESEAVKAAIPVEVDGWPTVRPGLCIPAPSDHSAAMTDGDDG